MIAITQKPPAGVIGGKPKTLRITKNVRAKVELLNRAGLLDMLDDDLIDLLQLLAGNRVLDEMQRVRREGYGMAGIRIAGSQVFRVASLDVRCDKVPPGFFAL